MDSIDKDISSNYLKSFGWVLQEFNHATPVTSHFVYINDWRVNKLWIVALSQEDFDNTKITTKVSFEDVVSCVANYINKTSRNLNLNANERGATAPPLINYIKQTQVFAAWRRQVPADHRLHFIINVYADSKFKKDAIKLRPFIANTDEIMLNYVEVKELTAQVQQVDKRNHPEWFR